MTPLNSLEAQVSHYSAVRKRIASAAPKSLPAPAPQPTALIIPFGAPRPAAQPTIDDILAAYRRRAHDTPRRIVAELCEHYRWDPASLFKGHVDAKRWGSAAIRTLAIKRIRAETKFSLSQIGKFFGGMDHTTILYAVNRSMPEVMAIIDEFVTGVDK